MKLPRNTHSIKHGHASGKHSKVYRIYYAMLHRCYNSANAGYRRYGGRGIGVCDRWRFGDGELSGFQCFLADMGQPTTTHKTLDRINNDGNYEPTNCRWATYLDQHRNKSDNHRVFAFGRDMALSEAIQLSPISIKQFYRRVRQGMSETEALETPKRRPWSSRSANHMITLAASQPES